ncbi:MAG: HPP family protein [Proteobacteria bacterium]|nr:HPP family protein [Pseudomonadota bacterium]
MLKALVPAPVVVGRRERWRAIIGALTGILVAGLLCRWAALAWNSTPWLMAPLGASAVLVFTLPASPLAQPWAVLVGNTLSALVGVLCVRMIGEPVLAAAVAVGASIGVMFVARALHPPGGASALLAVMSGAGSPQFALFPVGLNSLLLLLVGVLYNRLTGHDYPHRQTAAASKPGSRFSPADLDAALAHYDQVLDVSRADLEQLLQRAEANAYQRRLGDLRCSDVMIRQVVTADYAMPLDEAWRQMRERRIKALPVIDPARRLIGIVTTGDFLKHAQREEYSGIAQRMRSLVRTSTSVHTDKPEVVGQIMTRKVRVASADRPIVDLLPLLSDGGHHHVPIIDGEGRLAGIITQTDLIRTLYTAVER